MTIQAVENFKNLSTGKKAAIIGAAAVGATAAGVAIAAGVKTGKMNIVDGAKKLNVLKGDKVDFSQLTGDQAIKAETRWGAVKKLLAGNEKAHKFTDGLKAIFTKKGRAAYTDGKIAENFSGIKDGFNKYVAQLAEGAKKAAEKAAE